jgi:DNA-binding MarR family transcriptional regulator
MAHPDAIGDLDQGTVSVGDVSAKLNVRQPFVTAETKLLEKAGFVSRSTSPVDGRVVLMSLTEKGLQRRDYPTLRPAQEVERYDICRS